MGLYLYCIARDGEHPPPGLTGVDGAPVCAVDVESFTLWVSELDASPAPEVEAVRGHHAVVEASGAAGRAALPVRFGQWLASRAELEDRVQQRREDYGSALRRVAGSVEFAVRVVDPESAPPESGPPRPDPDATGREYMEALARRVAAERTRKGRARHLAGELRAALDGLIRDERMESPSSSRALVKVAHLVRREHLQRYRTKLSALDDGVYGGRLLVSGPWPPYSFAS